MEILLELLKEITGEKLSIVCPDLQVGEVWLIDELFIHTPT